MTLHHTRRVLWAFGLECVIFITILLSLDRFPSWLLTVCAIVAIALPIICYLTIVAEPAVYRSWMELGQELCRSTVTGIGLLWEFLSIETIRKVIRLVREMKTYPSTFDDWFALLLFPFKVYVIVAIPFMWSCHAIYSVFSVAPSRMGRSEALPVILTGHAWCLLALLSAALFQSLFSKRGRSTQTVLIFLLGLVMLWMLPWVTGR